MQHYPLVTVVGGSGFVGRHVIKALAAEGYRVRVLVRDTVAAEFVKTSGTPGQIAVEHADITRPATLAGKFTGSDAVINLVSILAETRGQTFAAINVNGAQAIAQEAKNAGAKQFIQISALGVDVATDTHYGATKLAGEVAVQGVFPAATIMRPSIIIGPEDGFFQRFARMALIAPALPLIGGGTTKFQPVLVTDVAAAILAALRNPDAAGKTYELAGTSTYSFRELLELMGRVINRRLRLVTIPRFAAYAMAGAFAITPLPSPITRDQIKMLAHDNVASKGALTLKDLGIRPASVEAALPTLLSRFIKA